MHKSLQKQVKAQLAVPDKLFYKIGEVSKITGIESYVLRYWETEFPLLKPRKNKSGQRVYVKKDLELILQLKKMLYQERYTIEGVRKKLGEMGHKVSEAVPLLEVEPKSFQSPAAALEHVKKKLRQILDSIK